MSVSDAFWSVQSVYWFKNVATQVDDTGADPEHNPLPSVNFKLFCSITGT